MQRKSSSSVKIYYPKHDQGKVVEELRNAIKTLADELGIEKVVLFGSYARNQYTVASDIDILVVFDETVCDEDRVYKTVRKRVRLSRLEPHLITKTEYYRVRELKWIKTLEKEGIVILDSNVV
ncbi:MAG: nucleotidyltransferase domain-containing protein [Nitrososphaeria archaeon]|nr:nucleotidyltransferase domain-containing protein [Nitrososphaeria archaeon]